MRKRLLLFVLLLASFTVVAQQPLSASRRTSVYTYIYRITSKETLALYRSHLYKTDEKYLHTLVDSFLTGGSSPVLPAGNYLFVYAADNDLRYTLQTRDDLDYKLVNNNRDLVVALHTRQGKPVTDATVFTGNRKMPFDIATQSFRLNKRKKPGVLKIYHNNVLNLFSLQDEKKRSFYRTPSVGYRIAHAFPLKYIVQPIERGIKKRRYYHPNFFYGPVKYENEFRGFMVFNKPVYKPHDTVKLKAFITDKRGKPVNRPLLIRLSNSNFDVDTILATITPYRAGGYEYSFVVNDTLDLSLDEDHLVTLEELRSRKYDPDEYDGDLDEEEYAARRKVLMRGKFEYEEYELSAINFTARTDKKEHQRGNPVSLYVKATDENNLPVTDGRVEVIVKRSNYANWFFQPYVFVPDTLWQYSMPLETVGETKLLIPDSIFPAASVSYEINCTFLNSNNERQVQNFYQSFEGRPYKLYFTTVKDSVTIALWKGALAVPSPATLYAFGKKGDTLEYQTINLPTTIRVDPFVQEYVVVTDSARESYNTSDMQRMVSCVASRTRDSVLVQLVNPAHLLCWYTVFAGNKVLHRGYGDTLLYADRVHTNKNYFVSLQYIYANQVYNEDYTIPYRDKLLTVQVSQPQFVYPGQTVPIDVTVTDAEGKAVANADITAYSFTSKFDNAHTPFIPYLGKTYAGRKRYRNFYPGTMDSLKGLSTLNWERWSREMGLDSITYFQFLHPRHMYVSSEAAPDSITQIAPFAVIKGELQAIQQIYIDEVPVFFNQSAQLQRYSFGVSEGKHSVRLRTYKQMITIDSIWATRGMKTFFCVNADTSNKMVRLEKMPDTLTAYEKSLWGKYMLLLENNFGETLVYAEQENRLFTLAFKDYGPYDLKGTLMGPFTGQNANLVVKNRFSQWFEPEGNYLFRISKGLIKQKQLPPGQYAFSSHLASVRSNYNFTDFVLTARAVDSLWQNYLDHRNSNVALFQNEVLNKRDNGSLQIGIRNDNSTARMFVKNILLFRYDDPDFLHVYRGMERNLGYLPPGLYRLFLLLNGDTYFIKDSITIRKNGLNYYDIGAFVPLVKDSVSSRIAAIVDNREKNAYGWRQESDLGAIKESFYERYLDASVFSKMISGQVTDDKGFPLMGVMVHLKGTKMGAVTDAQGYFQLSVPEKGTVVFSFIGYETKEKSISSTTDFSVKLTALSQALQEVVVVGYGTERKMSLTGAVTSVSGSNLLAGSAPGVMIRGTASIGANTEPLIIVDGLPFSGKISDLDESLVASINVLKDASATAIYGARAANGVVIVTTKKALASNLQPTDAAPLPGNTLRRNFRDDAYWQPRLSTNEQGKTSFRVTFPDDITNWRTFVIAINGDRQTGMAESSVSAFKALSANLAIPQFIVAGDTMNVIGKTMNYLPDSQNVTRHFYIDNNLVKQNVIGVRNTYIDTFAVTTSRPDSVKVKYTVQKSDGYFDGEERSIPVFQQGVEESTGLFAVLSKDTSFVWQPQSDTATVRIYAETAVLPVLLDEMDKLRDYEYLCNEQLASKLKGLLMKKKVYQYLGKDFKEERNIREIISRLNQNRSEGNLWGWWANNTPSAWISLHAIEALLQAQTAGYTINLNKQPVIDYLLFNLENYRGTEKVAGLHLLLALGAKADYKKYIDTLEAHRATLNLYETLRLQELKQQLDMPVTLDTLVAKRQTTLFGNSYWGEDGNRFFDNAVQNTLAMYRLLRKAGGQEKLLQQMQYYFLEKRKTGKWRNTYESSLILETILPDLLQNRQDLRPVSIAINGEQPVQSFPYSTTVKNGAAISIHKEGTLPVYFTAYSQYWNAKPEKTGDNFVVTSSFERNGQPVTSLTAGMPVSLKVTVTVIADAGYVMVEIPIPAGCSYKDKTQGYRNNEVHREYFKNKVSLFCTDLPKGEYTFEVALLPRYTGHYHLNPAKAEMMYFPVFFGREGMKEVRIQ